MTIQSEITTDIQVVIENEKRELTREYFAEVWAELEEENIDAAVIAEIFIGSALKQLATQHGDTKASQLLEYFKQLDGIGYLPERRSLQ